VIVVDTSGLLAAIDAAQHYHIPARETLESADAPLLLSPFVLAELDYLLATKVGHREQLALLAEVERGAYRLEPFAATDVGAARRLLERYADLDLGLADASNVVIAHRHGTRDLLTLDERHFRAVQTLSGQPFRLLPSDA
jgi:predicted nucleic acid-binding protein